MNHSRHTGNLVFNEFTSQIPNAGCGSVGIRWRLRSFVVNPIRLMALVLVLVLSSCSFTALKRLPSTHSDTDPLDCTSDLTFPLIDMAATVLSGVLAINLVSTGNEPGQNSQKISGYVAGGISLSFAASAVYGTYFVNKCQTKKKREEQTPAAPPNSEGPTEGRLGGKCTQDTDCSYQLSCDPTMKVCVRLADENL